MNNDQKTFTVFFWQLKNIGIISIVRNHRLEEDERCKRLQELHLCLKESYQELSCLDYLLKSSKSTSKRVLSRTLELIKLVPHLFSFHGLNESKT